MNKRPNILFITSDQQHWNTIGKNFPEIQTPNLDRLAADGRLFTRAYCSNPTCTPSRASLITGQYASRHGAWSIGTKLPESATTIGELLGKEGYGTSLIGKAHLQPVGCTEEWPSLESLPLNRDLDFWKSFHGPFYGFDHVELARNHGDEVLVGQHYAIWMEEKGLKDWRKYFQNIGGGHDFSGDGAKIEPQYGAWSLPEEFHMDTWITERSIAAIDRSRADNQPFFVWASFFDPHGPYLVPEPWASMYDPAKVTVPQAENGEHGDSPPYIQATQTAEPDFSAFQESKFANHGLSSHLHSQEKLAKNIATYYGMVSMLDHHIGGLLDHLDRIGERDNTLVVFTSDHGHYYGHHGLIAKGPFHYEDGIRVPFIVRWPEHVPAGTESFALQSLVDVPVSFLTAAGVAVPREMQGVDQLPVWTGKQSAVRENVLVEFRQQPAEIHMKTMVEDRYKITVHFRKPYGELYDLQDDPGEINNLWDSSEYVDLKAALIRRLLDAEMGAEPLWMPRISDA